MSTWTKTPQATAIEQVAEVLKKLQRIVLLHKLIRIRQLVELDLKVRRLQATNHRPEDESSHVD